MRIPVITTLPSQEGLQASALSLTENRRFGIPDSVRLPSNFVADDTLAAVGIGSGDGATATLSTLSPEQSSRFAVAGTIEADSLEDVPQSIDGAPVFAAPQIASFNTCGGDPAVGTHANVETSLNTAALHSRGLDGDGVAIVIMDSGVNVAHLRSRLGFMPRFDAANSWAPANVNGQPGQMPVDHGTMCAFDALIAAPKATLIDYPILSAAGPVGGSSMSGFLSDALQAYAHLTASWGVIFNGSSADKYKALVVNNSWGMYHPSWDFPVGHPGRYADNPNHPFNVLVAALARANADIFFAAGNCGSNCPDPRCQNVSTDTITGANALPEVLCVAGCDINNARVGYSSQGPAIANMDHEKPDITGYTHFHGSEAFGKNTPDGGTSTACPVVAGCIAALRTKASITSLPPHSLFAQLEFSARQPAGVASGWNADYGNGIVDPDAAAQSIGI